MKCGEVTHARELRAYLQSNLKPEKARGLVTSGLDHNFPRRACVTFLLSIPDAMLRNVSHGTSSNALVSGNLSLRALSTWLESNHVPLTSTPGSQRFASTRHAPRNRPEKETSLLPRYMRRQALQQDARKLLPSKAAGKEKAPATPVVKAVKAAPTFRSRHYDPEQETAPKSEIRLLEPHILSTRLKKLSDAGKVEDAIFMLKNAPLDAQNTQVWNTMIWETLKVGRYSLAYQLFVDVSGFFITKVSD